MSEEIINIWKKYGNEFVYDNSKLNKSFANMFNKFESEVLYSLVRSSSPSNILELGSYNGFTSHIIIEAIKKNNIKCKLTSSDLRSESKWIDYDDGISSRTLIIGDSQKTISSDIGELDFLFIDSDHTYEFAKWYCSNIIPLVKSGSFIMIHDWEGIEGDNDGEFKSVIENAVNTGMVKRCINLMEYTKVNTYLSSTPNEISYAKGDRNPSEILIKL
jgi:hypothetical protein